MFSGHRCNRMVQSRVLALKIEHMFIIDPLDAFTPNQVAIGHIVEAHGVCNPRVFGSLARGIDVQGSDLDIFVDPTPEATVFDFGAIRHELLQLQGVPVDVLTPRALPEKFRAAVLAEAMPI